MSVHVAGYGVFTISHGAVRSGVMESMEYRDGPVDQGPGRRATPFADRLADRQSQTVPSEDPDCADLGPAFPAWSGPRRDAILKPPQPEMTPSSRILQRPMDRDADWEAAD